MKSSIGPLLLASSVLLPAQSSKIDVYRAEAMRAAPSPIGRHELTQGVLERYPNHLTMFIVRKADGQAEVHQHVADVFVVTDGTATLLTGGTVREGKPTEPGEVRGIGLIGAAEVTLHKGDIVHIPSDLPHQLLVPHGGSFAYFVVKIRDTKNAARP